MAEGFRRVAIVLRCLAVLWFAGIAILASQAAGNGVDRAFVWGIAIVPAAGVLILAWIIDGFVKRHDDY